MKTTRVVFGVLVFGLSLAAQLQAQSFLTTGLIAYYPFEGNARDQSGRGNDLILNGAQACPDRFGVGYQAMIFTNKGSLIAAHRDYLNFPGGDFTIAFWVASADPTNTQYILGKSSEPYGSGARWIVQYGPPAGQSEPLGLSFHIKSPPNESGWYAPSNRKLWTGGWQHVLVRKASTQYDIFINSESVSAGSGLATIPQDNEGQMRIGEVNQEGHFTGKLDEIRLYNRAFSDAEVVRLYTYESAPRTELIKAVRPCLYNLTLGTEYQLQVSADLLRWTNHGAPFTSTSSTMAYPQYWDVANWNELFFRVRPAP